MRFEANGDSRKEIHALVKINDEAGARQFARLNFSYNRAFQSIEIPLARITHANGGTSDVLPSAITDNPDPAVVNFPAYQDIRVKSIRILGLEPDDTFEYRVVTTTTHHPLAPDFWFEHTFDRSGVVSREVFDLDVPAARQLKIQINPGTPATKEDSRTEDDRRSLYRWTLNAKDNQPKSAREAEPDVILSTFSDWATLSNRLAESLQPPKSKPGSVDDPEIVKEAKALTEKARTSQQKSEAIFNFVSEKIATVNLPIGSTGFAGRSPSEILTSLYATPEDKYVLFDALSRATHGGESGYFAGADLTGVAEEVREQPPRPSPFTHLLIAMAFAADNSVFWLDPSLEVAPFNLVSSNYRGELSFFIARGNPHSDVISDSWEIIPERLPFPASQRVFIDASIATDGTLIAKVSYKMRGDNELVLRIAFHQSPREKWDGVAQLLALSDGFRGKVTKTVASDPYETHNPFTVAYEITQPKFLDWSKKPLRVPALLPLLGLPDPPAKFAPGAPAPPIELGTPLDVEVTATLHLPAGTGAEVPAGTSVARDFATYTSHYSVSDGTLTASRHINFILKEIPADRAAEYNAFLHSVQNDESQFFTLERANVPSATSPKP